MFQSTRPIRGATLFAAMVKLIEEVSIHAPHTRRDLLIATLFIAILSFNPRAPYEARQGTKQAGWSALCFNPRAPYEARPLFLSASLSAQGFNPRAPYEARLITNFLK